MELRDDRGTVLIRPTFTSALRKASRLVPLIDVGSGSVGELWYNITCSLFCYITGITELVTHAEKCFYTDSAVAMARTFCRRHWPAMQPRAHSLRHLPHKCNHERSADRCQE